MKVLSFAIAMFLHTCGFLSLSLLLSLGEREGDSLALNLDRGISVSNLQWARLEEPLCTTDPALPDSTLFEDENRFTPIVLEDPFRPRTRPEPQIEFERTSVPVRVEPPAVEGAREPSRDLVEVHTPPPSYPRASRRRGEEGEVVVEFGVGTDGSCREVNVLHSSGHALLDRAAEEAIARWRFQPGGRPAVTRHRVRIRFRLKD